MTDLSRLGIIVVNYGSHDLLSRHLAPLTDAVPTACTVVVDNYTSPEERLEVEALSRRHHWQPVLLDTNLGFGAGVNRAVAALSPGTTHLLLLNPDATITADALAGMLAHAVAHPADLLAPTVLAPDGTTWSAGTDLRLRRGVMRGWRHRPQDGDVDFQPWLSGACLMLSRDLWDRIGGFDDDYFLYWEDVDLSRRALAAGARLTVLEDVLVIHDEGATHRRDTAPRAKSATYYYYNTRNRLLFAAKHLPRRDQRRWCLSAPAVAYRILLQGGRRQLVHPGRTLVPVVRGTLDGLLLMRRHRQLGDGRARSRA